MAEKHLRKTNAIIAVIILIVVAAIISGLYLFYLFNEVTEGKPDLRKWRLSGTTPVITFHKQVRYSI